ncbi:GNAT family N-acetyltransferase [Oerskovia flava]|uniref:GNAT family N-acetyltransferase n=1 Tax=Oerskovia flava TaxID=2986422 RepID=UPI00223EFC58|nr:GNAT family N-acetyltransferase [Oerskovia sp. JB1-3-2]
MIRDAVAADAAQLAEIYAHYVRTSTATFDTEPVPARAWAEKIAAITGAGWPFLVAVDDAAPDDAAPDDAAPVEGQRILGYAYVGPWRTRPAYRFTVEDSIYLRPDATGRGVGRGLLSELLERARAAGAREVVAVVADGDSPGSVALHRRLGFQDAGRLERVGTKFDGWWGTTLLQLSLHEE